MKTGVRFLWLVVCVAVLGQTALAANSVEVESKTVVAGETGVTIGIKLSNDASLAGLAVPLIVRSVTSTGFITSLQMSFADRMASPAILDGRFRNHYANPDGTCNPVTGGFGTITYSGALPHPVVSPPEGLLMAAIEGGLDYLTPGSDVTGSLVLTVDINGSAGVFEVDTTCTNPANHLVFSKADLGSVVPSFTKGTVTVQHPTVTNLFGTGPGSLRDAIIFANTSPAPDSIKFDVAGVIYLPTPLPPLADTLFPIVIDGFSAPGAAHGTPPAVVLDGSLCSPGPGLEILTSFNCVQGLGIRGFDGAGVLVTSGVFNTISQCRIHSNTGIAIDLIGTPGVDANDPGDPDVGANFLANFPTLDTALLVGRDTFYVAGTTSSWATVELYLAQLHLGDLSASATGHGDALRYLATTMADELGHFSFPELPIRAWSLVTAATIDTAGNTSELAANRQLIPDSLVITGYCPVVLTVITPNGLDSIGRDIVTGGFNTIGATAEYDSLTDYSDPLDGDLDDRVIITNVMPGEYSIRVTTKPGDDGTGYVLGIRVDGTNEAYAAVSGGLSSTPVENPVPPPGESNTHTYTPEPVTRGDIDGNGFLDAVDLAILIDVVFFGAPEPYPPDISDLNCDFFCDAVDLAVLIDAVFFGGTVLCP